MKNEQANQIRIPAVFFDGTGNNRTNSFRDPATFGNVTNISNLLDACVVPDRVYIEGIGTFDNKADSIWAKATGENPIGSTGYSYTDKLAKATNFLDAYRAQYPNDEIHLVIYGFSRGATLARDFAKRALAFPNIRIKFLGIYDTVESLLIQSPEIHFTTEETKKIDQILHFTAINETRKYFPLTSIYTKNNTSELVNIQNRWEGSVMKEVFVPGAHADVGGGYTDNPERLYLNPVKGSQDQLVQDLTIIKTTAKDHFDQDAQNPIWDALLGSSAIVECLNSSCDIVAKRESVKLDLPKVYLEVMAQYSNFVGNTTIFDVTPSALSPGLTKLRSDLQQYLQTKEPDKGPNYDYASLADSTHISSNCGRIGEQFDINQTLNTFDVEALKEEIERVKAAYPNENFDSFNLKTVEDAFGFDWFNANVPNNAEWRRRVIYG